MGRDRLVERFAYRCQGDRPHAAVEEFEPQMIFESANLVAQAPGVTFSSTAVLVRLRCRAATSKKRSAFSGGGALCMNNSHPSVETSSFVIREIYWQCT